MIGAESRPAFCGRWLAVTKDLRSVRQRVVDPGLVELVEFSPPDEPGPARALLVSMHLSAATTVGAPPAGACAFAC
jgi:hypothetical protein